LEYIIGNKPFASAIKRYYNEWKFKHPHPNDFFRIMEKESGMELDWFKEYWINTTHVTDYKIDTVYKNEVVLKRVGAMPMPIELVVTLKNGKTELYYIPLSLMRGDKKYDGGNDEYVKLPDWPWAQTEYKIDLQSKRDNILKMEIDPSYRMVDVNRVDNYWFNK
jgi:aminopeptidase N